MPLIDLRTFQRLTMLNVVLFSLIVVSGGAVRLTGSGLGCPTWPQCGDGSFVPHSEYALHGAIEFGNRMISVVLGLVALVTPLVALRLREGQGLRGGRRRDLRLLSFGLWAGFLGQAVLGGITVLTKLHPATVAAHFLLSMVVLVDAVVLDRRARQGPGPVTPAVRPALLWLARLLAVVAAGVLVLGTVVTGTGPHSGDADHPARFGFDLVNVSQLHADGAMLLVGLVLAAAFAVRVADAPAEARRASLWLVGAVVAQAAIGFIQYFTGVPAFLVALHMTGATTLWIFALRLWLAMSARPPVPLGTAQPERTGQSAGTDQVDQVDCSGKTGETGDPAPAASAPAWSDAAVPTGVGPGQRG